MEKYLDKSLPTPERARDLLTKMSLGEKMGQIVGALPFPSENMLEELREKYPHGIGAISCLLMMGSDLPDAAAYQRRMQEAAMSLSEHRIPAMFHFEGVNGILLREGMSFPSAMGRGASWNPQLEKEIGGVVGREADALGVSQVFAPVLDVTRDARFGRTAESYSEDAALVSAMGVSFTKGVQCNCENVQVEAVAKHFLGYHASLGGIHATSLNVPERDVKEVFAKPFQAAITEANLRGIMPAYNALNGEAISGSWTYLTRLLREEMGFGGITVSDYTAIAEMQERLQVAQSKAAAGLLALQAGMDVELPNKVCMNDELYELFTSGKAEMALLDKTVLRILTAKFQMGLFENPFSLQDTALQELFHHEADQQLSLRAAQESLVLLKNDGLLPLNLKKMKGKKIAVIGYHADTIRTFFGGYTFMSFSEARFAAAHTMAGVDAQQRQEGLGVYPGTVVQRDNPAAEDGARKAKPHVKSLLEELRTSFASSNITYAYGYDYAGEDTAFHEEALNAARDADLVILTLGGKYGTSTMATTGEGIDSAGVNLPLCQELFIQKLAECHKPAIGIHFDGRPISSDAAQQHLGAILEAWSPAEYGGKAIVSALTGDFNPGGRLPVTVAYHAGQEPIYYNHPNGSSYHQNTESAFKCYVDLPHEPRYFFGFGLSYTSFSYEDLQINITEASTVGEIEVSFELRNTGEVDGDEVVQLYGKSHYASVVRPNIELLGFRRVHLHKHKAKRVTFSFPISQLAYLNIKNIWCVEKGEYDIMVGAACNDIKLSGTVEIKGNVDVNSKTRGFYAHSIESEEM